MNNRYWIPRGCSFESLARDLAYDKYYEAGEFADEIREEMRYTRLMLAEAMAVHSLNARILGATPVVPPDILGPLTHFERESDERRQAATELVRAAFDWLGSSQNIDDPLRFLERLLNLAACVAGWPRSDRLYPDGAVLAGVFGDLVDPTWGADPDEIDELDGWERPFAPFVAELDRLGMLLRGYLRGTVEKLHVEGLPDAVAAVFEDLDPDVREPLVTAGWNFIRAHHWR
ncbi:MAG: hypothetical protein H0T97_13100 [Actinobacteria bacterium]|nr:hypothetical protein [Actinomycetota bacterium]